MEKDIIKLICNALEADSSEVSIETTSHDVDEWDSLGHLSILQALDEKYNDVTERVPELASVSSVKEIVDLVISDINS
jgi:acyl carrier protein